MSVHQVVTGALNKGENVYAIGNVEGITFTVCAVGSDVVILGSDFTRVQIIPGCSHHTEQLVTSVSCCPDSGKIAATYGDIIRVFEPTNVIPEKHSDTDTQFSYKWIETQCFTVKGFVNIVLWNMDGLRMLVVINSELVLYQHRSVSGLIARPASSQGVMFCIAEEDQLKISCSWDLVWSTTLSYVPKYIKYSPDGVFFAVAAENGFVVKVFYQEVNDVDDREQLNFEFVALHHPAPVRGFEWRRTGRYMPRKGISAAIITWCEDNTSRVWKETPPAELAVIDITGDGGEPAWEHNKPRRFFGKHMKVKTARKKIMTKLRGLVSEKKRKGEDKEHGLGLKAQIGRTPSMSDLHTVHNNNSFNPVQFHLASTINAETDCLLVPSMDSGSMLKKPFCVHWLNNKELVFSLGAERLLAETILSDGDGSSRVVTTGSSALSPADQEPEENSVSVPITPNGDRQERPLSAFGGSVCSESPSSKDILDVKLEILLRQWSKTNDILFTVHPVDGSLLVWTVEWLDDVHRQPVISFTSRFPGAFPITDASSLHPTLNTFNPHEPIYVDILRNESEHRDLSCERIAEKAGFTNPTNTVHVLTNHENGSLNLWHMAMEENSNFTTILNITHISRMCGHRFQIKQVVAHPVLPLLLTTSQFRSSQSKEIPSLTLLSEVILWKISPVGPLCKSGGVMELARFANPSRRAFSSLSWIPTILPSCTLGTVCNSPSSCFISSDGSDLVIYQAVIDARGLLSEIYESNKVSHHNDDNVSRRSFSPSPRRMPNGLLQQFKVVSTQSTAKPGCVLELGKIKNVVNANQSILLLHVFNERLVVEEEEGLHDESHSRLGVVVDRSEASTFRDRFFVVVVEKEEDCDTFLMYSLVISSQQPQPIPHYDIEDLPDEKGFMRPASPLAHSVAKLHFQSELVCKQRIPLPSGCRLVSAAPAAGHLPSSTIYPACQAPFVLMTSDTDDVVRFWRCAPSSSLATSDKYTWSEWNMVGDGRSSNLEVEGSIYSVSAAHSGRIACAYDPRGGAVLANSAEVEIGVFECESSGGVEWMREDTLNIRDIHIPNTGRTPLYSNTPHTGSSQDLSLTSRLGSGPCEDLLRAMARPTKIKLDASNLTLSDKIRLDWVSTEDGAHILTAGVAAKVYLYTQVSHDPAQQNVILMKESETTLRRPSLRKMSSFVGHHHQNSTLTRWVCTRVLALESADGLPPIPTTLSWARDGLLVVGMHSEMRVYNQWNLQPNTESKDKPENHLAKRGSAQTPTVTISTSYSMLDQLHKKKELMTSKSRLRIDLMNKAHQQKEATPHAVLEAISGEGLFEAARLSSPILPQYHPKQLIVLLNAGKTKRVKAILLHVLNALKQHQVSVHNPLSRAASLRRMSTVDDEPIFGIDQPRSINLEEDSPDYNEIDDIAPLPLYALISADDANSMEAGEKAEAFGGTPGYDSLFESNNLDDNDLDEMLKDSDSVGGRSRNLSGTSDIGKADHIVSVAFTAKHNRALTELLTHTHLPGLSSVDQMHLLAIADTLSHFSSDVMDKLAQANAAMQPVVQSVLGESAAGGYATAAAGVETVDECGLRFLMSMKQHEYLVLCLPPKQRVELKKHGLSSSNIIWAQHSETETELLNAVPFMQKANPSWDDFRNLGVAWWLKNTASLRICIEKLAKAAFQQNQDPMDASLFYLAMKKKNVLTHLFKTSRNQMMADFFSNDFSNEHWRKVAAKNAFVLMSKQRFQHAAAFFLLSGSLKDAVQTILRNCNDLQLAMVVVRLHETDMESQQTVLREILCREVLGVSSDDFEASRGKVDEDFGLGADGKRDPFERSMAYWYLKDYTRAAHTLVEEAQSDRLSASSNTCLSDIFNFYSFLRRHPLVVRQRITDAGAQVGSTEKFIALGKQLEALVTPPERRLFFRTAAEHMARGCPMLALEVLSRLPKNMLMVKDNDDALRILLGGVDSAPPPVAKAEDADWSQPTNVVKNDELDLGWSDDDEDLDEFGEKIEKKVETPASPEIILPSDTENGRQKSLEAFTGAVDVIAQHLKFVASLRILTEELSTLASGFEVDGGQLRYQLFTWLEKEVEVLKSMCDYRSNTEADDFEEDVEVFAASGFFPVLRRSVRPVSPIYSNSQSLYDALKSDHAEMVNRLKIASRRRKWLTSNQKLLRSFTSYCALHCGHNHRLTSALMELLLLLLEIQKDSGIQHLSEAVPDVNSFPLLEASVSSTKMFVSSPLSFIENQCHDLLLSIANLKTVPSPESNLQKAYVLYNLCQGLSSCLYQSLCDVDQFNIPHFLRNDGKPGALTRRSRFASMCDDIRITTSPNKWPGLDNLVALMGREKDDDGPHLRILLAECFVAIVMSLFCFAVAAHDARWLYRLASHDINESRFGLIFGGGGHKKMKAAPPTRPPRPAAPRASESEEVAGSPQLGNDAIRSKFHTKLLGPATVNAQATGERVSEQTVLRWVPPQKNIVQMFAEKPPIDSSEKLGVDFDSDDESDDVSQDSFEEEEERCEAAQISSYAWLLMRLALVEQQMFKLKQFLTLAGFDISDIPSVAPRLDAVLRLLANWSSQIRQSLRSFPGGCPIDIIPNTSLDFTDGHMAPTARKYASLLEKGNTPFESDDSRILPIKRLWAFLVRENHLQNLFILHIYSSQGQQEAVNGRNDTLACNIENQSMPEAFKIIQKDSEPIVAFACNQQKSGLIVVSNGRELQEMNISSIFDDKENPTSWLYNRTDLDMQLLAMKKDTLRDNDDYQLFTDSNQGGKQVSMQLTPWIVDRSRCGLQKLLKRTGVNGIRRIDSHPTQPYYVTGSTDGSIRVWEWGARQAVYTARVAGQFAKVSKITFSCNGNKFAAVDGDGMLCMWQASQATEQKKPFFSHRCHNKSATDVRFLGHSSSVLITAGASTGEYNLGLWDTLLPQNRALVHSWVAHNEGATCAMYLPTHQTIVSGGRHGDICLWDVRQRQLRATVKAFEPNQIVKSLVTDLSQDLIVAGSSEGDIKIWSADGNPQLMYSLAGEHTARGGFSFRQVSQSSVQGVQQLYIDQHMRLFSCGADATLKFRTLPSVYTLNI